MSEGPDVRPAFYALTPGGWRDYWSLLHPPYTLWHLSYVAIGAALASTLDVTWWLETTAAFLLAMGVAAHALDELDGRPLRTRIPGGVLIGLAVIGLAGALAIGVHGATTGTPWIWALMPIGVFLVVAYNLELAGGWFHSDLWFAIAWGGFPVVVAYVAQTGTLSVAATLAAAGCAALSAAQRALSTPVRTLRRHVTGVSGSISMTDGSTEPIDADMLRHPPETALRLLSISVPLLAAAMIVAKLV
ncbi:MAG: UbiA family prenyltransferase [Actinomycetota bacterium]